MIYSKIKYDALCSFYDLIEHGENYVVAAEQAIKQATTYHGLKQIIFNITIIERILLLNVVLSPYLIDKGLVAIKISNQYQKVNWNSKSILLYT